MAGRTLALGECGSHSHRPAPEPASASRPRPLILPRSPTLSDVASALAQALADRYRVEREIGVGGMATVYLAEDLKHHRKVALKVLKPELGAVLGAERFLAEIRVTANLQHPHLLPLFDSGEAAGLLYYVMPFVDGESLRARLTRERQLPIADAVSIAVAVAGALDYAYRQGIVHRDLKPENILLQEGLPLVADFGVSLAVSRAGGERVTQTGLAVGTPQYMSPEQAAGERQLDARSDVYALGAVLYELLTGEPPHGGVSTQVIVARVIGERPRPMRATRPSIPEHVESAVMRALEKVPADRFATARELAVALAPANSGASATRAPDARAMVSRTRLSRARPIATVAVMLLLIGAGGWWSGRRQQAATKTARFVFNGLPNQSGPLVVTPDGNYLLSTATTKAGEVVTVRRLDSLGARELPGTEGVYSVFPSPDGRWLAFVTGSDELRKVSIEGGVSTPLANAFRFATASWGDNDAIVYDWNTLGLQWVSAAGGDAHQLTRIDSARLGTHHRAPFVLPGGGGVVFVTVGRSHVTGKETRELSFVRLDLSARSPAPYVDIGVSGKRIVAFVDGWLLYQGEDERSILAVRFDAASGRARGEPVTVLTEDQASIAWASLSRDGTLVYSRPPSANPYEMQLIDETGTARSLPNAVSVGTFMNPRLSPDGGRLVVQGASPQGTDVWMYDIATHAMRRFTNDGNVINPGWTPDGQHVIYVRENGGYEIWRAASDGNSSPERILTTEGAAMAVSVQPDGRGMVFQRQIDGRWSIWRAPLSAGAVARPVLQEPFDDYMPTLSPDGRWLAYVSKSTGDYEIYLRPYPSAGTATQISEGGGTEPRWSHDGRRLFYINASGLHAATINTAGSVSVSNRVTLKGSFATAMPHANYDVARDDRSFVTVAPIAKSGSGPVVVVNWLQELEARLARTH